jgi:FkbM family methyltransferase
MSSRAKAVARTIVRGLTQPRLALLALRERGLAFVFDELRRASPQRLDRIVRGLSIRSATETRENLERLFVEDLAEVRNEDERLYRVRLTSGETFVIRKEVCVSDMRVVWETFVRRDYAEHPPLAGKTVLDVGANLGDTSAYYALQGAHVIAYEPSKELFDLAVRNAALNGLDVEFHNLGIGCEDCSLEMAIGPRGASPMSLTMFPGTPPPTDARLQQRVMIDVVSLADVLARLGSVFLMKMDCEGCEYPSLLGLPSETLRTIEHVLVEYHESPEPLCRMFEKSGYAVRMKPWRLILADRLP